MPDPTWSAWRHRRLCPLKASLKTWSLQTSPVSCASVSTLADDGPHAPAPQSLPWSLWLHPTEDQLPREYRAPSPGDRSWSDQRVCRALPHTSIAAPRSEERRVGKENRAA